MMSTTRAGLVRIIYNVPLNEFSLIAVPKIAKTGEFCPETKISLKPSMSFTKSPEQYNQLQQLMQRVVIVAGVPPISFDLVAWNLAHDKLGLL